MIEIKDLNKILLMPGWQGRASRKHPVGVFSEEPDSAMANSAILTD
jgi:hypothetical protein